MKRQLNVDANDHIVTWHPSASPTVWLPPVQDILGQRCAPAAWNGKYKPGSATDPWEPTYLACGVHVDDMDRILAVAVDTVLVMHIVGRPDFLSEDREGQVLAR